MKRLSEIKDEEALDLLANILTPVSEIAQDQDVKAVFSGKTQKTVAEIVAQIIKAHKGAVMDIMAALEGVPREDYHCNILTLPKQIMTVLNDPDLMAFFREQGQIDSSNGSGSVTENIEEEETQALS